MKVKYASVQLCESANAAYPGEVSKLEKNQVPKVNSLKNLHYNDTFPANISGFPPATQPPITACTNYFPSPFGSSFVNPDRKYY